MKVGSGYCKNGYGALSMEGSHIGGESHSSKNYGKKKVLPGFEPGLFGSEPKVITTTL